MINYCNQCPSSIRGLCCYFSYYDGQDNFAIFPCPYLSKKTRRCKIYKKRFKINPNCLDMKAMIREGAVPKECAYLENTDIQPIRPFKTINKKKRDEIINGIKKRGLQKIPNS